MERRQAEILKLREELIRVKAERDAFRSLIVGLLPSRNIHAIPGRIDAAFWPIGKMKMPEGY